MHTTRSGPSKKAKAPVPAGAIAVAPMASDFEPFARQLLSAMVQFREGNFAVRLPSDMDGVPGKVADVFNDVMAISERRAKEVARVCRVVGKEGRLRERMVLPGAEGSRADEVAAIVVESSSKGLAGACAAAKEARRRTNKNCFIFDSKELRRGEGGYSCLCRSFRL
jgi:hypothetical protein